MRSSDLTILRCPLTTQANIDILVFLDNMVVHHGTEDSHRHGHDSRTNHYLTRSASLRIAQCFGTFLLLAPRAGSASSVTGMLQHEVYVKNKDCTLAPSNCDDSLSSAILHVWCFMRRTRRDFLTTNWTWCCSRTKLILILLDSTGPS